MRGEGQPKSSRARVIDPRRIDRATELWADTKTPHQIVRALMNEFGVSSRQAHRYFAIARRRATAAAKTVTNEDFVAKLDGLMLEAIEAAKVENTITGQPNAQAMIAGIHRLAELHGLIEPAKLKLDANVSGLADILAQAFQEPGSGGPGKVGG